MSTLQVALAIAGGVVLAGLVAHSAWSSRKNTPRQAEPTESQAVREPEFDAPVAEVEGLPAIGTGRDDDFDMPPLVPQQSKASVQDALIDVLTLIELESPASGDAALAAMPSTRRVGTKLFTIEGLHAETGEWEGIRVGQRYSAFQAGLQLANRLGPLNEIEFSEYVVKTQNFADAVDGTPEFPEMLQEVARGRELDQFATEHDAQLSFTLRARDLPWSPGFVQQNAARLGFVPGVIPGRMVVAAPEVGLPPILGLSYDPQAALADDPTQAAIRKVVLTLDVPQVDRSQEPFPRMCQVAGELARAMDGTITDDDGKSLSDTALQSISRDLQQLYDTLDARDLSAGSLQARRLFS
ncbi:MAG: cell division protein ZipA C-terminal FtsZ-binding domain-containing protein [Alphaproteobacteria bacterium]|nr:cell division protein ZipA C-terminal FtsZ-binding domain-containing protein [Alphaproteobacteria bacterium]